MRIGFNLLLLLLMFSFFWRCSVIMKPTEELNSKADAYISQGKVDLAIPLVKKSAKRGNAEAQYNLGYCYEKGVGVEINQDKAYKWYEKSAVQNYTDAEYALMMIYAEGRGVEKDESRAFDFALRCARKNDPTCMFNVIGSYQEGIGVEADTIKMMDWAFKLAKLPNPKNLYQSGKITSSRLQIANMYTNGNKLEKDNYKAYIWYLIYNENKRDIGVLQQEQIIERIKALEEKLSENQLQQAKNDAEALINRPLNNVRNLYHVEDHQF